MAVACGEVIVPLVDRLPTAAPSDAGAATEAAPPVDPTLAGYWNFDEGTGTTALDSSGHGNNGVLQGGAGWGPGRVGNHCLALMSAGAFVDIPETVVDTSKPYSVSAWVQLTVATGNQTVVSIDGNVDSAFFFKQHSAGSFTLEVRASDDVSAPVAASAMASAQTVAGSWYYFTGVFDGSTVALYVDGAVNSSAAFGTAWRAFGHTAVGRSKFTGADADFVTGYIDEVRMYSRALSAPEVQALYLLR